jgi:hypothetical protein
MKSSSIMHQKQIVLIKVGESILLIIINSIQNKAQKIIKIYREVKNGKK